MASKRLLDKRREHEAAEKQGKVKASKKAATSKKGTKKASTRKRKVKAPERKRLLWGVFSGTLKEEGRFNWDERDKAEEKLALLKSKSKKAFFIQPIKEAISDAARPAEDAVPQSEEEEIVDEESSLDDEDDIEDEEDDDEEE